MILSFAIGTDKNILPASPRNLLWGRRASASAGLGGAQFLQASRFLRRRRMRGNVGRFGVASVTLEFERIDHSTGRQHGCGKPRNEILESGRSKAGCHVVRNLFGSQRKRSVGEKVSC